VTLQVHKVVRGSMLDFPTDVPNLFEKVQAQDWERLLVDRGSGIGRPTWQTTSDAVGLVLQM